MSTARTSMPVRIVDSGSKYDKGVPQKGIGLCFSGGGYRAMLFHTGALWRINEAGFLPQLDRISSVSGGSILAATLGLHWPRLDFDQNGVAARFREEVLHPIRTLASKTLDVGVILRGALGPGSISEYLIRAYREHLFGKATLQDLPDKPRFVINATSVQSGVLWRFSKPYMADYRVGRVDKPRLSLARAVAASSAFPPVLSPVKLKLDPSDFVPESGKDLQRKPFTTKVILTDGGVYDNLGLETVWKRYDTVLIGDGGGQMQPEAGPRGDWVRHTIRTASLIDNQVRALRKRQAIDSYIRRAEMLRQGSDPNDPAFKALTRRGAYWGIRTDIRNYHLDTALPCPPEKTVRLAEVATRLKALDSTLQEQLINWGFAVCDAALRKHVDASLPAPDGFPYPQSGVG